LASVAAQRTEELASARDAVQSVQALYKVLADKVGSDRATDVRPLREMLQPVAEVCARALGVGVVGDAAANQESAAPAGPASGEICSPDDAPPPLDRGCGIIERAQPPHPPPPPLPPPPPPPAKTSPH